MKNKSYMTISEFAHLTGIKRANLIFYDKIGLLSPESRGENDYRYYTRRQLGSAFLIIALRDLSIGLDEIRQYADGRTPERMITLFESQKSRIQNEVEKLNKMQDIMDSYISLAQDIPAGDIEEIIIREQKEEPLFRGLDIESGQTEDQNTINLYEYALAHNVSSGCPLGAAVMMKAALADETDAARWYYFKVKKGANTVKPAGRYAVAYGYCPYGQSHEIYCRLAKFIEKQGLTICFDAYEEYPLNEICIPNEQDYLVKVEVMVH